VAKQKREPPIYGTGEKKLLAETLEKGADHLREPGSFKKKNWGRQFSQTKGEKEGESRTCGGGEEHFRCRGREIPEGF